MMDSLSSTVNETFNSTLKQHEGNNISSSEIKNLVHYIVESNSSQSSQVSVNFEGQDYSGESISDIMTMLNDSKKYTVSFEYTGSIITKAIIK